MHLSHSAYQGYDYVRKGIANRVWSLDGVLADTQMRGQVPSNTAPAHRMCFALLSALHFAMLIYTKMRGQVLSSTAPAHRMCHTLLIVLLTYFASLVYTQMRGQVLSSTAPAHRISHATHSFTFCVAGLRSDEGPSALKYRTCAQNVSDVIHRFRTLGCWPTPR